MWTCSILATLAIPQERDIFPQPRLGALRRLDGHPIGDRHRLPSRGLLSFHQALLETSYRGVIGSDDRCRRARAGGESAGCRRRAGLRCLAGNPNFAGGLAGLRDRRRSARVWNGEVSPSPYRGHFRMCGSPLGLPQAGGSVRSLPSLSRRESRVSKKRVARSCETH